MKQYLEMLNHVLEHGEERKDRTGVGTKSVFGYQTRFDLREGFPLLTTKKIFFKSVVYELLWFLKGKTNIRDLLFGGCDIWTGDAYKQYQRACMYELEKDELTLEEFRKKIKEDFKIAT